MGIGCFVLGAGLLAILLGLAIMAGALLFQGMTLVAIIGSAAALVGIVILAIGAIAAAVGW